jgi:hypothetical protein
MAKRMIKFDTITILLFAALRGQPAVSVHLLPLFLQFVYINDEKIESFKKINVSYSKFFCGLFYAISHEGDRNLTLLNLVSMIL